MMVNKQQGWSEIEAGRGVRDSHRSKTPQPHMKRTLMIIEIALAWWSHRRGGDFHIIKASSPASSTVAHAPGDQTRGMANERIS
jgi:hypothetical protein